MGDRIADAFVLTPTAKEALKLLDPVGATLVNVGSGRWTIGGAPSTSNPKNWVGTFTIQLLLRAGYVSWTGSGRTGVRLDRAREMK